MIPSGFEPETHSLEGCCSIQLSYGTPCIFCGCKGINFLVNDKILDCKFNVRAVVKGVVAWIKGLGGLEEVNAQRVLLAQMAESFL